MKRHSGDSRVTSGASSGPRPAPAATCTSPPARGTLTDVESRTWHRLAAPPSGLQFEALLDFAVARRGHYPTFLLVQRTELGTSDAAAELLATLAPELVTAAETDRWPGTFLHGGTATVRFYRLERHAAQVLGRCGSLAAFVSPLPEDLCVLASDKTPWLVSATREGRFLLHLTAEELRAVAKALPWLQLREEPSGPGGT